MMEPLARQPHPVQPTFAPGWYADPSLQGVERWWDGAAWTGHARTGAAPVQSQPLVVQTGPHRAVSHSHKDTSHTFHLLMTLLTCGLWALFVWGPIIVWHALGPRERTVTWYR